MPAARLEIVMLRLIMSPALRRPGGAPAQRPGVYERRQDLALVIADSGVYTAVAGIRFSGSQLPTLEAWVSGRVLMRTPRPGMSDLPDVR